MTGTHGPRNLLTAVAATFAVLAGVRVLGALVAGHTVALWRRRHFRHHPRHERRSR